MRGYKRVKIFRKLLLLAIIATVLLSGLLMAGIYVPRATVRISPDTQKRTVAKEILLSKEQKEPDFQKYILPAKLVEKTVEVADKVKREDGSVRDDYAKGKVVIYNAQESEQPLLPNTHLKHGEAGVFFLTDKAVRIPPKGEIEISVTAKERGASGNVPAGKWIVDKLPQNLQKAVYAESSADFSGGQVTDNPVTEAELAEKKGGVKKKTEDKLFAELSSAAGGAGILPELANVKVEREEVTASPGSQTTSYEIRYTLKGRAFVVDQNDLLSLSLLALRSNANENEEFVSYEPESFSVKITRADFERGQVHVTGTLDGFFAQKTALAAMSTDNLAGMSEADVRAYMSQFENVGDVGVDFWPFWVKSVPGRKEAVKVELHQSEQ